MKKILLLLILPLLLTGCAHNNYITPETSEISRLESYNYKVKHIYYNFLLNLIGYVYVIGSYYLYNIDYVDVRY